MANKLIFLIAAILVLSLIPIAYSDTLASGGVGVKVAMTNYDPSPAKPGKFVTLYLKAENPGGDEIKNAYFLLEPNYPFSFQSGETATRDVSTLGPGEQFLLQYNLLVDKNALEGSYTQYLKICFDTNCTSFAKTSFDISVQPGGTPSIEASLESSDTFSGGKTGTVTLQVINRGSLNTKYMITELKQGDEFDLISPPRIYIGELTSDDSQTVDYEIYIKAGIAANKTTAIKLPLLVEYSDANDKEYSQVYYVPLTVYSMEDLTKLNLVPNQNAMYRQILMAIIGLAAVYMIYKWYKKKKSTS
jgi:hypothetical protein